jgi:hypothetical protein
MSTIASLPAIAMRQACVAGAFVYGRAAAASVPVHIAAGPVALLLLAACFVLVGRVHTELVSLVSHLIRTAAAVGSMLLLVVVVAVLVVIVVLHA